MVEIKFNTSGAAFEGFPGAECVRILKKIVKDLEDSYEYTNRMHGSIMDINGNKAGEYDIDLSDIDID